MCKNRPEEPLWKNAFSWNEANQTIAFLMDRYHNKFQGTMPIARDLHRNMASLFPLLDALCMATCTHCTDPCCLKAYAWFDLKDLLFAHLNNLAIPPAQLMTDQKMTCRYLGVRGCTLERISRPWICTWYLCPTQYRVLRGEADRRKEALFQRTATEIRFLRKEMETVFIDETWTPGRSLRNL